MKVDTLIWIFLSSLLFSVGTRAQYRTAIQPQDEINAYGPVQENKNGFYNVKISIDHYYPYCGGAYPDESDLNNYSLVSNTNFLLYNIETGIKKIVTTNSDGVLYLDLPYGKYGLKQMFQESTFEEFLTNNKISTSDYYQQSDLECYRNWWSGYFLEFEVISVVKEISMNYTFSDACFTGNNPCISYFGPYPP